MIPHCLFQFIPVADEIYNYFLLSRLEPISAVVASAISQHLQGRNQAERVEMLQKLEGGAKASSFYGFLFEPQAHEVLIRERHFQIRSLDDSSVRALDFTADSQIEFIDKKSCAEYADTFLQIPLASNYRSRDSWFVGKLRRFLVFFQVTSSYRYCF
jgi:hypothetical protein